MNRSSAGGFYLKYGKRTLDLLLALPAGLLALPVCAVVAAAVRLSLGSPVLFRQRRPGRGETPFEILKFRTMRDATDSSGRPLPDSERLTPLGRWLRRTSLDELPELINVLSGQMSLVGPRPLRMAYLDRYESWQRARHDVPPGITGWAQVRGRNALSWQEKFELDVWYVERMSLWLDLKILALTVGAVLRGRGISAEGHATMPEFGVRESAEASGRADDGGAST